MASVDWYFDFISPFAYLQCEQSLRVSSSTSERAHVAEPERAADGRCRLQRLFQ